MPGTFVTLGLYVGGAAFAIVMVLSWQSGTAPEWAVLRGLAAFGAFAFLGWLAAYIAGTAPPAWDETMPQDRELVQDPEMSGGAQLPAAEPANDDAAEPNEESVAA